MPHFECGAFNHSATSPGRPLSAPPSGRARDSRAGRGLQGAGAVGRKPAESCFRPGPRAVFAADKAVIAQPVEFLEEERKVQFAAVGLVATGYASDLDMADERHEPAQRHRDVAVQNLAVIDIELQLQIRPRELLDRSNGSFEILQEVTGNVAAVDRLDRGVDTAWRKVIGCESDIVAI